MVNNVKFCIPVYKHIFFFFEKKKNFFLVKWVFNKKLKKISCYKNLRRQQILSKIIKHLMDWKIICNKYNKKKGLAYYWKWKTRIKNKKLFYHIIWL